MGEEDKVLEIRAAETEQIPPKSEESLSGPMKILENPMDNIDESNVCI
jgi:hypothetical protein